MAGVNTDEEFVAIDGIVASGTYGVAVAPVDATSALGGTWTDHGLTTDAGATRSQPTSRQMRRAWQKKRKLRTLVSEAAVRFQFTLVQTSAENVGLFHGVPLVAGSLTTNPERDWPLIAFDLDRIDGANVIREYAPRARVVEVGDQVALSTDSWGYPITVEAEYDSTLGGYTKQFYSGSMVPVVATITTAVPASQAVGEIVELIGTGFGSTVSITVGGVATPVFSVITDAKLHLTLPAGGAGSAPIIVTNVAGASAAKAYTRA